MSNVDVPHAVASLAPDKRSVRAAEAIAELDQWHGLGRHESLLFGTFCFDADAGYDVCFDWDTNAYRCGCPSRKRPCKHALALVILEQQSDGLSASAPPEWVKAWQRETLERQGTSRQRQLSLLAPADEPARKARGQARKVRLSARESRVLAGVDELTKFLEDRMRQGLATTTATGYRTWDEMASRLVDAQAPGLARTVRELGGMSHASTGWQTSLLDKIGRLHLLLEAYRRIEHLPVDLAADVRSLVGFTVRRESVLEQPGVRDKWWVVGRRLDLQDNLSMVRSWYWGESTQRFALTLAFAAGGRPIDVGPPPGSRVDANMHYYPSAVPLRALSSPLAPAGRGDHAGMRAMYRCLLANHKNYLNACDEQPWLDRFPMALRNVTVQPTSTGWRISDANHSMPMVPFGPFGREGWTLLAIGGVHPMDVFGEYNGESFAPFAALSDEGHVVLAQNELFRELAS